MYFHFFFSLVIYMLKKNGSFLLKNFPRSEFCYCIPMMSPDHVPLFPLFPVIWRLDLEASMDSDSHFWREFFIDDGVNFHTEVFVYVWVLFLLLAAIDVIA